MPKSQTEMHDDQVDPESGTQRTGGQIIAETMLRNGTDIVFGLPGGTVIPLYDDLLRYQDRLRHILVRHEQGAVHAADSYARVTGKPGVAIATSGPGCTNLVTGMMNARLDSVPMVVFGGQVATSQIGSDAFQECDMVGLSNPITKHNFQPRSVEQLECMINKAYYIARTGRPGPVYIDVPRDVQAGRTSKRISGLIKLPGYVKARPVDTHAIARAAMLMRSAARPVLLIGHGAVLSEAAEPLGTFARTLQIPVVTTILAKGIFNERDPLSLGCVGMHGRRAANYAMSHCDVVIAVGCRFSDRATGKPEVFAKGKKIIHVDVDPAEIGKIYPVHVGVCADARDAAEAFVQVLPECQGEWGTWTKKVKRLRNICHNCVPQAESGELVPRQVMMALNEVMSDDEVVATGVGQHQMFASHYLLRGKPRTFVTSGGAGTMGFGLPAAIGAAAARPGSNVWLVDGDGSFQMTLQELATLKQLPDAKVNVVIVDNGFLGMVRQWQELYFDRRYSAVDLTHNPDFVKIAEAYGIPAVRVQDAPSLKRELARARDAKGSRVIHVSVQRESNILPMIPAGAGMDNFSGHCISTPGQFFSKEEMAPDTEGNDHGS